MGPHERRDESPGALTRLACVGEKTRELPHMLLEVGGKVQQAALDGREVLEVQRPLLRGGELLGLD